MTSDLQCGALDRRITLKSATESIGPTGQRTISWTSEATVWAKVEHAAQEESLRDRDAVAVERLTMTIRYYSGLANTWAVTYAGRHYTLTGAPREIGRRQWHQFECEYVGETSHA